MPPYRIVRRAGLSLPRLRGIRREGGPAAIDPSQFWDIRNYVPVGGVLVPRGGQTKVMDPLLPGMTSGEFFNGMFDESVGGASVGGCGGGGGVEKDRLTGAQGESAGDGEKLYWWRVEDGKYITFFDEEKTDPGAPYFPTEVSPALADVEPGGVDGNFSSLPIFWRGELWWSVCGYGLDTPSGLRPSGWGLYSHPPAVGAYRPYPSQKLWTPTEVPPTYVSDEDSIGAMAVYGDKLYFILARVHAGVPPLPLLTYEFDGVQLRIIDTFVPLGDTYGGSGLLVGVDGFIYATYFNADVTGPIGQSVTRRIPLPSGAVLTCTIPVAVGFGFNGRACTEYKGKLYLSGFAGDGVGPGTGVIYSTTGGTDFTLEHNLPGSTMGGLCVFNGYLYYNHIYYDPILQSRVGRFDGFTWEDEHVNMNTGDALNAPVYARLISYKGSLIALPNSNNNARRSQGTNTDLPWAHMQPHYGGTTPDEKHINNYTIAVPE